MVAENFFLTNQFGKHGLFRQDLGAPEIFFQVRVRKRAKNQGAASVVRSPNCHSRCGIYAAQIKVRQLLANGMCANFQNQSDMSLGFEKIH